MSYLLDTHTILWFVNESPKLPLSTRELTEESTGIFTSIVSFWEMAIKDNLDKLSLPVDRLQHSFKRNDVPVSYVIFSQVLCCFGLSLRSAPHQPSASPNPPHC